MVEKIDLYAGFAMLDGSAVRYNESRAYVYVESGWKEINRAEIVNAYVLREAVWKKEFGKLPPSPLDQG